MPVMARICDWKVVVTGKIFSEKKSTCDYLCDFSSCEVCHFKVWWFYDLLYAVRAILKETKPESMESFHGLSCSSLFSSFDWKHYTATYLQDCFIWRFSRIDLCELCRTGDLAELGLVAVFGLLFLKRNLESHLKEALSGIQCSMDREF